MHFGGHDCTVPTLRQQGSYERVTSASGTWHQCTRCNDARRGMRISVSGVWSRLRRSGQPDSQMPPADDLPHTMSDTTPADALAEKSGRRDPQTNMDSPPKPDIDDWLGSLDRDLGSTPTLASQVPAHPPADAPSWDKVSHASEAVEAVAPPEAATGQPVAGTPGKIDAWLEQVDPKDAAVSVVAQKTDGLEKHLDGLLTRAAELQQKQTDLESAQDRLSQVDELTWARFDALQKSRADLKTFQEEIHAFRTSRAEITEVAGKLAADRTAFEGFVQRVADFQQRMPGLDSEMDSISTKWSVAGKAVTVLGKKTDGLETRVDTLQRKQTDLESLQDRLNQVDELSNRTGAQLDALQKSRADLETFQAEIQAFHASHADITEAAGKLAADRTAFEGFVQRGRRLPAAPAGARFRDGLDRDAVVGGDKGGHGLGEEDRPLGGPVRPAADTGHGARTEASGSRVAAASSEPV